MRNWIDSAFIGTHGEVRSSTSLTTTQYLDALELGTWAASAMYAESYWPGFLRRTASPR